MSIINGVGVGLRSPHINEILNTQPAIPYLELLADNYIDAGGLCAYQLDSICERYPVTLHSVGLSLAGIDPLDTRYLQSLKALAARSNAALVSDHLCFSQFKQHYFHDLCPIPYTEESLKHVAERIIQIQDYLGIRILVENVSAYVEYNDNQMSEAEFLNALCNEADCDLLLDINNLFVNENNLKHSAKSAIEQLPTEHIKQIHLAGFHRDGDLLIDSHSDHVDPQVWELFKHSLKTHGNVPCLIEWDNDIPPLEILLNEAAIATKIMDEYTQHVSTTTSAIQ